MEEKKRIYYLDVLRTIACIAVIMIHSSATLTIKCEVNSTNFEIGNVWDALGRIGVPLFVMISGALMLDKNYNCSKEKMKKHIARMIEFFMFWSILYCIIYEILIPKFINHDSIKINKVITELIKGHYHLWFIYLIIGVYLIVPLLRLWVKDENKKYVKYFIILSIFFVYIIKYVVTIGKNFSESFVKINDFYDNSFQLKYIGGYTAYFLLGWYLNNYDLKHKKCIYILGILGLLVSIIGTSILSSIANKSVDLFDNLGINVLAQSVAVFVFIKDKFKEKENENKVVKSISKHSLGIYAMHPAFITVIYKIFEISNINNALICIPIAFAVVFLGSYLGTYIFSKIPGLRKVV